MSLVRKRGRPPGRPGLVKAESPKATLATKIRELSADGEIVMTYLVEVLRGNQDGSTRDRMEAAKILLAYGWGKPVEVQVTAEVGGSSAGHGGAVSALSSEQLEAMLGVGKELPSAEEGEVVDGEVSEDAEEEPTV